jgi:hypothetical protein
MNNMHPEASKLAQFLLSRISTPELQAAIAQYTASGNYKDWIAYMLQGQDDIDAACLFND